MVAEIAAVVLAFGFMSQPTATPLTIDPPSVNRQYGVMRIPSLNEREVIRVGAMTRQLDAGIGHLSGTVWPGQSGLGSYWAHRVTPVGDRSHGPFRYINRLDKGDRINIRMPYGRYHYRVTRHKIIREGKVGKGPWSFLSQRATHRGPKRIMIAACHPAGSAEFRYVVFAREIRVHTR